MRVLLLGAGGMLGHDLVAATPREITLFPLTHAAVDRAETEPQLAFRVNAHAVEQLAHIAAAARARLLHFSTDYVFDGTSSQPYREDAEPRPLYQYGASKLAGERALQRTVAEYLIVRTQWL